MGKKNKKFNGHETGYDYLKSKFDKGYRSFNANRESEGVYKSKKDEDFQRYLYTGKKTSGSFGMDIARKDKDKKKDKADRLFEAGIPVQQWDYYKDKAGNNANSKSDIKDIIAAYNADERYQGPGEEKDNTPELDGNAGLEYYNDEPTSDDSEPTEVEMSKKRTDAYERRMAPEYFGLDGRANLRFSQTRTQQDEAKEFRNNFRDKLRGMYVDPH